MAAVRKTEKNMCLRIWRHKNAMGSTVKQPSHLRKDTGFEMTQMVIKHSYHVTEQFYREVRTQEKGLCLVTQKLERECWQHHDS